MRTNLHELLLLGVLLFSTVQLNAQVTVGSNIPPLDGALLQLKERQSTSVDLTTANKGLSFPRVALSKTDELYPMYELNYPGVIDLATEKRDNIGLVVYNVTSSDNSDPSVDRFIPGLYIWDGANWTLFQSNKIVASSIDELLCGSATLTPASYTSGVLYKGVLKVPYRGGNGGFYDSQALIEVNGLKFKLESGRLAIGNGEIYYTLEGMPNISSPEMIDVPINFLGQSCTASVGNVQEISTISFAKTTAQNFTDNNVANKTTTILGNLAVRVERLQYSGSGYSYYLTYKVGTPTHVTVLYTKSGESLGYMVTGRKAAKETSKWYRVKTTNYNDGDLNFDENWSAGPTGRRDDFTPGNRDVVEAIFMLHATNEVYRVTINSNGGIAAAPPIGYVPPTITIFLEKLD